MFFAASLID